MKRRNFIGLVAGLFALPFLDKNKELPKNSRPQALIPHGQYSAVLVPLEEVERKRRLFELGRKWGKSETLIEFTNGATIKLLK